MAPALNEPLNQAQLPLSPASASSSPRPGILPNGNGSGGVSDPVKKQHGAITNRFNKPSATNPSTSNSPTAAITGTANTKPTFQCAFIQQISSRTTTNGPAPTGPPNVQRHMDRKDSPSGTAAAAAAAAEAADKQQQRQPQPQPLSSPPQPTTSNHHQQAADVVAFSANKSTPPPPQQQQQHQHQNQGPSTSAVAAYAAATSSRPQPQPQPLDHHLSDSDNPDDEATLKSDVQELTDLGLHLDDETANALIDQHSLCDTPPHHHLQHHQPHHQQQQHPNHQHHNLLDSPTSHHNNNTMGLQKDYLKDNPDMEQMLGELANTSDMDLLQVFKSLAPSGTENLCDLASGLALFNDVDVMNIGLDEVQPPVREPDTADLRLEIKKRQGQMQRKCDFLMRRLRKLQTRTMSEHIDEEVHDLFEHAQRLVGGSANADPEEATIEGTSASLLKRLVVTADEQQQLLPPTVQQQQQQRKSNSHMGPSAAGSASGGTVASACLPGTSAGGALRVVPCFEPDYSRRLALTAGHLHTELKIVGAAFDSDATASSSGGDSGDEFSAYSKQQSQSVYSTANVSAASSTANNGKESIPSEKRWCFNGERMVRKYKTKKIKRQELRRAKRAATRWARDRASIAARWSWLLAQVSDLEYRIRQHSELHQQIKRNKGAVTFEDGLPTQAPAVLPASPSGTPDATVNGYRGLLPGNNTTTAHKPDGGVGSTSTSGGETAKLPADAAASATATTTAPTTSSNNHIAVGSCRTRAFQRNEFRKRKLLQTTNLHTISKKAAKPSTVKCGCQWPLYPCALCTGRPDPTAPRDLPDMLSSSERVGLLDAGFHPVISFASDIKQGITIESTLRNTEFQTKACRATTKSVMRSSMALQRAQKKEDRTSRKLFGGSGAAAGSAAASPNAGKKKYNVSNKLKKKAKKNHAGGTGSASGSSTPARQSQSGQFVGNKQRRNNIQQYVDGAGPMTASQQHQSENFEYGPNGAMLPRSKNTSPTPGGQRSSGGSSVGSSFYAPTSGRSARGAYDIDNIVIPLNMVSSGRLEILKVKEILTPKWRMLDEPENSATKPLAADQASETTTRSKAALAAVAAASASTADAAAASSETATSPTTTAAAVCAVAMSPPKAHDLEDVSDEAIQRRHEHALAEERKKFANYLKFPWSTGSRSNRRIDSRADSSGANTPDPTSPALPKIAGGATAAGGGGYQEISQHPPTSAAGGTALNSIAEQPETAKPETSSAASSGTAANGSGSVRRRTVSTKRISGSDSRDSGHINTDQRDYYVQPYEQREFPLSDEALASLLEMMPSAHHDIIDKAIQQHEMQQQQQHHHHHHHHQHHQLQPAPSTSRGGPSTSGAGAVTFANQPFICKTEDDFERLIATSRVIGPISGIEGNPYGYALAGERDSDEETESIESGMLDEDANDPDWMEPTRL